MAGIFKTVSWVMLLCLSVSGESSTPNAQSMSVTAEECAVFQGADSTIQDMLKRQPLTINSQGAPVCTVGVIPYTVRNKRLYCLLGRETKDGTWSDFGGRYNPQDVSIRDALAREYMEETASVLTLNPSQITLPTTFYVYIHKPQKREVIYMLLRVDDVDPQTLQTARDSCTQSACKEKDKFQWVSIEDMQARKLPLRKYFKADLVVQPEFQSVLSRMRNLAK